MRKLNVSVSALNEIHCGSDTELLVSKEKEELKKFLIYLKSKCRLYNFFSETRNAQRKFKCVNVLTAVTVSVPYVIFIMKTSFSFD